MTEKVTTIRLSELTRIRMTCNGCGLATEANLGKAYKSMDKIRCPECDSLLTGGHRKEALVRLHSSIEELMNGTDAAMHFVLSDNDTE